MTEPTMEQCFAAGKGPEQESGKFIEGGLPDTPEERARFESYMRGHCWEVGEYDLSVRAYDTVLVRMLYGVWRDRGALCKLQSIESQPVPVEPKPFGYLCEWDSLNQAFYYGEPGSASVDDWNKFPKVHHNLPLYSKDTIDSLQSALKLAQEERDAFAAKEKASFVYSCELTPRNGTEVMFYDGYPRLNRYKIMPLETYYAEKEAAESRNKRMVELLKEPSEGMIAAGYPPNDERAQSWDVTEVFKAMSDELLKEVEK